MEPSSELRKRKKTPEDSSQASKEAAQDKGKKPSKSDDNNGKNKGKGKGKGPIRKNKIPDIPTIADDEDGGGVKAVGSMMVFALIPAIFIFHAAYQNIKMPHPHHRPYEDHQVREVDLNFTGHGWIQNYTLVSLGPVDACAPLADIAALLVMANASRVRVMCDPWAEVRYFSAFKSKETFVQKYNATGTAGMGFNFEFVSVPEALFTAGHKISEKMAMGGDAWKQAAFGEEILNDGNLELLMDTWLDFAKGSDAIIGPAWPWTTHALHSVSDVLGIPAIFFNLAPGFIAANEFVTDPNDYRGGIIDLGYSFVNYYLARARLLWQGIRQRSIINTWRAKHDQAKYWIAEANSPSDIARVPVISPWVSKLLRGPREGLPRFARIFNDLAVFDEAEWPGLEFRQGPPDFKIGSMLRKFVNDTKNATDPNGKEVPLRARETIQRKHLVYIDLPYITEAEATSLRDALVIMPGGTPRIVVSATTTAPRGNLGWGPIESFVAYDMESEAVLPRSTLAFHHGDTHSVSLATRAGTPQVVLPYWITAWTSVIEKSKKGTTGSEEVDFKKLDPAAAAAARVHARNTKRPPIGLGQGIGVVVRDRTRWHKLDEMMAIIEEITRDEDIRDAASELGSRISGGREASSTALASLMNNLWSGVPDRAMREELKARKNVKKNPEQRYGYK